MRMRLVTTLAVVAGAFGIAPAIAAPMIAAFGAHQSADSHATSVEAKAPSRY
jgi:hypothetical protein